MTSCLILKIYSSRPSSSLQILAVSSYFTLMQNLISLWMRGGPGEAFAGASPCVILPETEAWSNSVRKAGGVS